MNARSQSEICENCGKPALFWNGRSRKFFNPWTVKHVMSAGWCSNNCWETYREKYKNPTEVEVAMLFEDQVSAFGASTNNKETK